MHAMNNSTKEEGFATKAIHTGQNPNQWSHQSVVPPIVMSATFQRYGPEKHTGFEYSRLNNPNRNCLETCMAALENGKHCIVSPSGMGTITGIMSLLKPGDHLVSTEGIYGGTYNFLQTYPPQQNIEVSFVDSPKTDDYLKAIKPNTKMILIESTTNPLLIIVDIKDLCEQIKKSRPDIYVVVDNTFVTCYFQRPLELGADISIYSVTKYLNGHSDVIMGAAITSRDDIGTKLRQTQTIMGIHPSPFDCSMVNRSLKTLELRMQRHMENGMAVAKFLEKHDQVSKVFYPYLPSHPQYKLALKQMSGFGGMVSFYIKGNPEVFLSALKIFTLAQSLGCFESLACLPSIMTNKSMPADVKDRLGINDKLIRLSVGLESVQDLINDLEQALTAASQ